MSLENLSWQWLIIIGSSITALGQALNKYQVHRGASLLVQFYKYIGGSLLITFLWWQSGIGWPRLWWAFLLYGIASGVSVTLWAKAVRIHLSQSVSIAMPAIPVISVILAAIFLKEWQLFNLSTSAGQKTLLALMLLPVIFYFFHDKKDDQVKEWSVLVWMPIIFVAATRIFLKYIFTQAEPLQVQFLQYWGSILVIVGGIFYKGHKWYVNKAFTIRGILQGLFTSIGVLLYYLALKQATVTQTSLLRQPTILVITILVGLIGFGEAKKMTRKKWLGVGTALLMTGLLLTINR